MLALLYLLIFCLFTNKKFFTHKLTDTNLGVIIFLKFLTSVRGLVRLEGDSRRSCVATRVISTADNVISASDRQLLSYHRRLARIRYVTAMAQVQSMIMFVKILIQEQNCIELLV